MIMHSNLLGCSTNSRNKKGLSNFRLFHKFKKKKFYFNKCKSDKKKTLLRNFTTVKLISSRDFV